MVVQYNPFLLAHQNARRNLEEQKRVFDEQMAVKKQERDREISGNLARGLLSARPEEKQAKYMQTLEIARQNNIPLKGMPTSYSKEIEDYLQQLSAMSPSTERTGISNTEFSNNIRQLRDAGVPEEELTKLVQQRTQTMAKDPTALYQQAFAGASGKGEGTIPTAEEIEYLKETGKRTAELETARPIEMEKFIGKEGFVEQPTGELEPIKGSEKYQERKALEKTTRLSKQQAIDNADVIITNAKEALSLIKANPKATTGSIAKATDWVAESPAGQVKALLDTVGSNVALNKLIEIKQAGGTFGALQEKEFDALADSLGKLKNTSNPKVLAQNIERVIKHYTNLTKMFSEDLAKPLKYGEKEDTNQEITFDELWGE